MRITGNKLNLIVSALGEGDFIVLGTENRN
jgi:hypothetical protein